MAPGNVESASDKANARNLEILREYTGAWKTCLDSQKIWPKDCLYDRIAFSLLNKLFRLGEASAFLIEGGFSDEAFGLSRSMIDCTLNLRYLTLDREKSSSRSEDYLDFFFADRKHYLDLIRKYYPKDERKAAAEAIAKAEKLDERWQAKKGVPTTDWKPENWWKIINDKHPLDAALDLACPIRRLYSNFHRGASATVHCSVNSLANFAWDPRYSFKVGERRIFIRDHTIASMSVIADSLYLSVRYAFYGAKLAQTKPFDDLYAALKTRAFYQPAIGK